MEAGGRAGGRARLGRLLFPLVNIISSELLLIVVPPPRLPSTASFSSHLPKYASYSRLHQKSAFKRQTALTANSASPVARFSSRLLELERLGVYIVRLPDDRKHLRGFCLESPCSI